jgi:hypothetical protein
MEIVEKPANFFKYKVSANKIALIVRPSMENSRKRASRLLMQEKGDPHNPIP